MAEASETNTGTSDKGATDDATTTKETDDKSAEVDKWKAMARKHEAEAKANAGAAKRLAELEEANKSEAQKMADRAASAEAERDAARVEMLRFRVAAKHGISEEDADLFLTGSDEETLTKQAKRLTDRETERKKSGNRVAREGQTSQSTATDQVREFTRNLFGANDS